MTMAKRGYLQAAQALLRHHADVTLVDAMGSTALWISAFNGQQDVTALLIKSGSLPLINKKGQYGSTPLAAAAYQTHPGCVQVLLDSNADVNIACDSSNSSFGGQVPLTLATLYKGHLKPDNIRSNSGAVSTLTQRLRGVGEIVKLLVNHGADPNVQDVEGFTPVNNMVRFKKNSWLTGSASEFCSVVEENANWLLNHGANPNLASNYQVSPLHMCAYNGYPKTAAELVRKGADVNAKQHWGKTPLDLTGAGYGQMDVAGMLRQHGGHR